jgi:cytochrome P450
MTRPINFKSKHPAVLGKGEPVIRSVSGIKAQLFQWGLARSDLLFAVLRNIAPILVLKNTAVVTRYDDVKEVFLADEAFAVPYAEKLNVIMGGVPFFLGMGDTEEYRRDTAAMRKAVPIEDVAERLVPAAEAAAERAVARANGKIEVVGELFREVTFEVLLDYFGTPLPPVGDLYVWASRIFEFQFADASNDPALRKDVDIYAPALRNYIQDLIEDRRSSGEERDDVLGRCLDAQAKHEDGFSDDKIRCALVAFIGGGMPQLPMLGPNALEQLLRRPKMLAEAQVAARNDDDGKLVKLAGYVFEAMRFDPLGPGLMRTLTKPYTLAAGTSRAKELPKDMAVFVSFASAMRDGRRVRDPEAFIPGRPPCNYIHFGHGLHECFGLNINRGLLPAILKPLLKRHDLTRTPGAEGYLRKQGVFADRLVVRYQPA